MKVYGQLEKAQIENVTVDPTGTGLVPGIIWFRSDLELFRAYDGTQVREFADLDSAQTMLNKILSTGTQIQNPTRLDIKKDTFANLTTYASSASDGQLCYSTDTNAVYQITGNALVALGGASSISVRADSTSGQSIGTSDQTVIYENVDYDATSAYNNLTGVFTAAEPGKFLIHASYSIPTLNNGDDAFIAVSKNGAAPTFGSERMRNQSGSSNTVSISCFDLVDLAATDTLEIKARIDTAENISTSGPFNVLSIIKVGV